MKMRTLLFSILMVAMLMTVSACASVSLPFGLSLSLSRSANSSAVASAPAQPESAALPAAKVPAASPVAEVAPNDLLSAFEGTLEQVYTAVSPSVVNIRVVQQVSSSTTIPFEIPGFPFFSMPQDQQPQQQYQNALGSGFVWDEAGHIVTNNHVVSGADKIEVTFSDGSIFPATLVGADPDSDLAVIKVESDSSLLQPVQLANSDEVKVGQMAIAIGNPFGLEGTMTTGIISAVGRSLPASEESTQSYTIPDIIQTDAPINPGNSGGVLVNAEGNVIGVTSAIESPVRANAGIGFAIPANIVNQVVPSLINDGKYEHSWLGISGSTLIPDMATAMDLPADQRGVLIRDVFPNSPAEEAGLRGSAKQFSIDGVDVTVGGDVITAIDGQPLVKMEDLIAYLASDTTVGQKATLTILRDGKQQSVEVILAARPSSDEEKANQPSDKNNQRGIRLGIIGMTVNEQIASEMDLSKEQQGVLIQQVESGSLADKAGLQGSYKVVSIDGQEVRIGGDIIVAVNGKDTPNIQTLKTELSQIPSTQVLTFNVLRDGKQIEVTINPEG